MEKDKKLALVIWLVIIGSVVFVPNIIMFIKAASHPMYAPSDAWIESLIWLRYNTPPLKYDYYAASNKINPVFWLMIFFWTVVFSGAVYGLFKVYKRWRER